MENREEIIIRKDKKEHHGLYAIYIFIVGILVLVCSVMLSALYYTSMTGTKEYIKKSDNISLLRDNELTNIYKNDNIDVSQWSQWKSDVLGIALLYPAEWREPSIYPETHLTNLALYAQSNPYSENNSNSNNISIDVPLSGISLRAYNEKYAGEKYPNGRAYQYGYIDNFNSLKSSRDICNYTIDFRNNPSGTGTLEQVFNMCENGIKTTLIKQTQDFGSNRKYTYTLNNYAFVPLANGYYDNLLLVHKAGQLSQVNDRSITLDSFFDVDASKTGITVEQFHHDLNTFKIFVKNITVYQPPKKSAPAFENISGEHPDVTAIRNYYYAIMTGQLKLAYELHESPSGDFTTYAGQYKNTILAEPYDINQIGNSTYRFFVRQQDDNQAPTLFRIIMSVAGNKVAIKNSEKLTSDFVTYNDMYVFVKADDTQNYVVLGRDGKEEIIDSAKNNFDDTIQAMIFRDPIFSSTGRYLSYAVGGWEWGSVRIYDIRAQMIAKEFTGSYGFDTKEDRLYVCASDGMGEDHAGVVYSLPDFKIKKDLVDYLDKQIATNIECALDQNDILHVKMSCFVSEKEAVNCDRVVNIEYNMRTDEGTLVN